MIRPYVEADFPAVVAMVQKDNPYYSPTYIADKLEGCGAFVFEKEDVLRGLVAARTLNAELAQLFCTPILSFAGKGSGGSCTRPYWTRKLPSGQQSGSRRIARRMLIQLNFLPVVEWSLGLM
ncbi:MAG TPA: hypothetical protein VFV52_11790 [Bacilli bacterium]|nr:hypothetical protein [Bacilli bacterium]